MIYVLSYGLEVKETRFEFFVRINTIKELELSCVKLLESY